MQSKQLTGPPRCALSALGQGSITRDRVVVAAAGHGQSAVRPAPSVATVAWRRVLTRWILGGSIATAASVALYEPVNRALDVREHLRVAQGNLEGTDPGQQGVLQVALDSWRARVVIQRLQLVAEVYDKLLSDSNCMSCTGGVTLAHGKVVSLDWLLKSVYDFVQVLNSATVYPCLDHEEWATAIVTYARLREAALTRASQRTEWKPPAGDIYRSRRKRMLLLLGVVVTIGLIVCTSSAWCAWRLRQQCEIVMCACRRAALWR